MLEARSVALVGASPRPGSLGARMIDEVAKSASAPRTYLVNPRYGEIGGGQCYPAVTALPEAVDLALLAVPDAALAEQVRGAAEGGVRAAVIFGSAADPVDPVGHIGAAGAAGAAGAVGAVGAAGAVGGPRLRDRIAGIARDAGMPLCGAGCMGFVNVARGLRAIGYTEPDPLPAGPVALVTHSGSVFSALLRTRRAFGFTVAVSSGQELVTPAAAYARYALTQPQTRVLALVLEAIRDGALLRTVLADAAARDIPVVLLTAGASDASRSLVAAHSGALAAGDGAWQALASAYGVHRVGDLAELADTLELFCAGRRAGSGSGGVRGLATVHDSGFERAHVADLAASVGVRFAPLGGETRQRLAAVLDPGLEPGNPLDVWGTGRDSEELFTETLAALADDDSVGAVALAVDLVPEYDGDDSYRDAVLAAAAKTDKPVVVLASVPAAIDADAATRLRAAGVPVLESTRTGLLALGHLLSHAASLPPVARGSEALSASGRDPRRDLPRDSATARRLRWSSALSAGPLSGAGLFDLLRAYGIPAVNSVSAGTLTAAAEAAAAIGYPVAIKTDEPGIAHKSDVGGVRLNVADPAALAAAYEDLAARLGPRVTVCAMAAPGTELILGMARDPALGPLIVVGAGGMLAEYLSERAVALPPLSAPTAAKMISGLRVAGILAGIRGQPPCDLDAAVSALVSFSLLVADLGKYLDAFEVNPLICSPSGVLAVDALAVPRASLSRRPQIYCGYRVSLRALYDLNNTQSRVQNYMSEV
jgi:acyl-CoA synthetase (NDP forming)